MCPQCLGSGYKSGEQQSWKHSLGCPESSAQPSIAQGLFFFLSTNCLSPVLLLLPVFSTGRFKTLLQ